MVRRISGKRGKRRRNFLIKRQENKCYWCDCDMTPAKQKGDGNPKLTSATIDHLLPLEFGGRNFITNTVAACWSCNNRRNTEYRKDGYP